jgi:uncharacterized protein involved in exopolysaccharide biosynthesis
MAKQLRPENGHTGNGHMGNGHNEEGFTPSFTLRNVLAIGFRHRRLAILTFLLVFAVAFAFVMLRPARYEAQMKILVKRERVDPLVTPDESSPQQQFLLGVTEEELNSEVELLKSRDLLTQVVVASGIQERKGDEKDPRLASAVERVARRLEIQPLRKSNVIQVSYASTDPDLSAKVLKTLAERYLEKHLAVHRPPGAFAFFETETERYGAQLALAQARLNEQNREEGVVAVQVEREAALQRLGDLEAAEQGTQALIADTAARIRVLDAQVKSMPARRTSEIRRSANLLEQLHSTLLTYEIKRIELVSMFQPSYPPVLELDAQIAGVRDAIARAEKSPIVEESTNLDPTYDRLVGELATARSELAGLQARAAATSRSLRSSRDRARRLEQVGIAQQTLVRAAAQAEQNYLTYSRKREEARIANALDAQRILNVAIAEEATAPFEPSGPSRTLLLLLGVAIAGVMSVIVAFIADYLDPSFRTPDEVQVFLGLPVLASIPRVHHTPSAEFRA